MSKVRDIINTIGTFGQMISWVGIIYKYFSEGDKKEINESYGVYSMIELGVYEWTAVFLCITSFLLIYNKRWTQKNIDRFMGYIDEFTGKAKEERKYRKWLELENKKERERKESEDKKEQAKIQEENKKIEKRNQYIELLKEDFDCDYSRIFLRYKKYYIARSIEILRELGFIVPSTEEQSDSRFEDFWKDFLPQALASVEIGTEKSNLDLWKEIYWEDVPF